MARVRILERYCKACELCVAFCPCGVLAMSEGIGRRGQRTAVVVAPEKCTGCLQCTTMCPDAAIEVDAEEPAKASGR